MANHHRKNHIFKNTRSQRHKDYCPNGTRITVVSWKAGSRTGNAKEFETDAAVLSVFNILAPLGGFWCHFWTHRISKGVPKSTIFWKKSKKNEKKEVQKTALKKHDLLIDLSLNFGWIWVSFLMFFLYLYHSHMQPSKSSKTMVFAMNFNDFTLQRNMIFDDFPDLFRYQF